MPDVARPTSPTLFIVDGYALVYRAFYALLSRPLRTAKGENTSAAWGIVNFLQRLLDTHHPDYLAWVHDAGTSFRHEVFPGYKATREKLSDELQADFEQGLMRVGQLLEAFHAQVLTVEGYEADDVIGTLAREATERGINVVVVSGDKDFQQLVRPGVWLLNPGRGGPASVEEQWVGVENASERLGVPPEFVTDFLALVGDSSDNVPGVPGIGEKTARDLVSAYGGLESIILNAASISKKRPREGLLQFGDQARLSKRLVTIRTDVPVALDLETLRVESPDLERLRQLCVELEFSTLLRSIDMKEAPSRSPAEGRAANPLSLRLVCTQGDVDAMVRELRRSSGFALACATVDESPQSRGDPLRSRLVGVAFGLEGGVAYYLPLDHRAWSPAQGELLGTSPPASVTRPEGESLAARAIAAGAEAPCNLSALLSEGQQPLREVLGSGTTAKWTRNAKWEQMVLRRAGVRLEGVSFDAMLASYVLDPGRRSHDLEVLALEFLNRSLRPWERVVGKGRTELPFDLVPPAVALDALGEVVDTIVCLNRELRPRLADVGADPLLTGIELPLVEVLAEMEWQGVSIDLPWFRSLKERFQREREAVERAIYSAAGEEFNINSNPQLRVILFDKLQLPVRKRTATGPSTDASVLQELADDGHEIPILLMEYRELAKLESTYLDTLPHLVSRTDHRLHTTYNQTVAATGRLSSSDPNLQNIPIRRELGRDIRRGFVPRSGWKFVVADYSQIELRILAHLSGDPGFVGAFRSRRDIHRETAAIIFGVPAEVVSGEMRARAKTINFATIYGQGAHALSRQLRITNQEARDFIATYFERFAGVRAYLDGMVAFAREHGYVETIFHRRRYIPELKERNFNIRAFGERVATNAPIQGSAADLIKIAMIRLHQEIRGLGLESRMILQVHDELVFEGPVGELDILVSVVRAQMEGAARLEVPLLVDIGIGHNWMDAKA